MQIILQCPEIGYLPNLSYTDEIWHLLTSDGIILKRIEAKIENTMYLVPTDP